MTHDEYMAEWRERNKDKIKEYQKAYRIAHRDELRRKQKAWHERKGIIRGRQEEKQSLIYPDYDETYKKGYADGVREAIRMAGKEVGE